MTRWRNFHHLRCFFLTAAMVGLTLGSAVAQDRADRTEQTRQEIVAKGLDYLAQQGQAENGTFSARVGPGVTALAVTAALRSGRPLDDAMVRQGLNALEGYVKSDGGIYGSGRLRNYETCVAMLCFSEANQNGQYNEILQDAKAFITELQYGAAGRDKSDPWYGGVGYAGSERPDLSNTGYFIEALRAVDTGANSEAIQRALVFVSRCQNLDTKHNDTEFASKVDDGGFYYTIPKTKVDPSTSERYTAGGGLRSYGSMTYTGLKSMIYAGLTANDPRVKAAVDWIGEHYGVDSNPGMGDAGLYYYYHTFAASLDAAGIDRVQDSQGDLHNWRADLVAELASRQQPDGSWSNDNGRWFENDKNLATSFALMALAYCEPPAPAPSE